MTLHSPMNKRHNNCAVKTENFTLKGSSTKVLLLDHFKQA